MKNNDQQPDKPKKKPQPKAASKKSPKKDQPEPRIIDLGKIGKNSLTLGQYKELSKRDRTKLSPTQIKQLEQADKQLKEAASHVASAYKQIDHGYKSDFRGTTSATSGCNPRKRAANIAGHRAITPVTACKESICLWPTVGFNRNTANNRVAISAIASQSY